jgi:hypothetical protein
MDVLAIDFDENSSLKSEFSNSETSESNFFNLMDWNSTCEKNVSTESSESPTESFESSIESSCEIDSNISYGNDDNREINQSFDVFSSEAETDFESDCLDPKNIETISDHSDITLGEFTKIYLLLIEQAGIQDHQSKKIYRLFHELFPKLPMTYNKFTKIIRTKNSMAQKACLICKKLIGEQNCDSLECIKKKKIDPYSKYDDPVFIKFDFIQHLKYVLEDKWVKIIEYKGKKIIYCIFTVKRFIDHSI